jgi:WD40 repeat protein
LRIWDIEGGTELAALPVRGEVRAIALAPDGDTAAILFTQHIELWNLSSESLILSNQQVSAQSLDFTPDGAHIIVASEYGQVSVIETATGRIVNEFAIADRFADMRVHVLEGGEFVFVLNGGDTSVYDWRSGEQIASAETELGTAIQSNVSAASEDRTRVAFALYDYSLEVSHLIAVDFASEGLSFTVTHHPERISSIAFTADGTKLLTGSYDSVRLWDLETGVELGIHKVDSGTVKQIAISPDGERAFLLSGQEPILATYSTSDMIIIIDLAGWIEELS